MVFTAVASSPVSLTREIVWQSWFPAKNSKETYFPLSRAILYYSPVLNANCFRQNGNINWSNKNWEVGPGYQALSEHLGTCPTNTTWTTRHIHQESPQELETMRVFRGSPSRTFWRNSIKEVGEESVAMSPRNSVCFASPLLSWLGMNLLPSYWTKPVQSLSKCFLDRERLAQNKSLF